MFSQNQLAEISSQLVSEVKSAGKIIKQNWDKPKKIFHKTEIDWVTDTDFAVQDFLEKELAGIIPDAIFLGEEHFDQKKMATVREDQFMWIVDPLDGTTNFAHGVPCIAISLALCQSNKPLAGVIYQPLAEECFYAAKDSGAFLNNQKIHVSEVNNLQACLCASGSLYADESELNKVLAQFANILRHTQALRMPGSAAINMAYVACGRLDGFFEAHLKPWDIAAGWLLVEEAGGLVTDYLNNGYTFWEPVCATNKVIHPDFLRLICQAAT